MQRNVRSRHAFHMDTKKKSPKRDKIVRNLKTSLLGDIDYLTSINLSS